MDETTTGPTSLFDFGTLGDTRDHEWHPRNPVTDEPIAHVTFIMAGEDTDDYRKAVADATAAQAKRMGKAKNPVVAFDEFTMDVAVGVLKAWTNVGFNGVALECTPENKRRVFTERRWLYDQWREFINARAERLGNS